MCLPWSVIDDSRYWAKSRVNWRMLVFGGLYRTVSLTGDFCFPIWSLKVEHSIEENLCPEIYQSICYHCELVQFSSTSFGSWVMMWFCILLGKFFWGEWLLLSSLNQVSVNARMSSLLLIISVWILWNLLPADQQFSRRQVTSWCLVFLVRFNAFYGLAE